MRVSANGSEERLVGQVGGQPYIKAVQEAFGVGVHHGKRCCGEGCVSLHAHSGSLVRQSPPEATLAGKKGSWDVSSPAAACATLICSCWRMHTRRPTAARSTRRLRAAPSSSCVTVPVASLADQDAAEHQHSWFSSLSAMSMALKREAMSVAGFRLPAARITDAFGLVNPTLVSLSFSASDGEAGFLSGRLEIRGGERGGARTAGTMHRMQAQTKATTRPYGTKQRSSACCASTLAWPPAGVWLPDSLACRQQAINSTPHGARRQLLAHRTHV